MNDATTPLPPGHDSQPNSQELERAGYETGRGSSIPQFAAGAMQGPMSLSQILDRIVRLMRSRFRAFVGIAGVLIAAFFLCYVPIFGVVALAGGFSNSAKPNPAAVAWSFFPAIFFFLPIMVVAYALYCAAASHAALQADLGLVVTVREAFAKALEKPGRYVWLMILRSIYVTLPALAAGAVIVVGAAVAQATRATFDSSLALFLIIPVGILAYFGSLAYGIFMSLRLSLAIPASVVENLTAAEALRRSGQLTKDAKGRIFLVLLVIYAATYLGFMVLFAVLGIVGFGGTAAATAAGLHLSSPLAWVGIGLLILLAAAGMFLFMAITYAGYSAAFAVLYHDQRRRELPLAPGVPA